MREKKQNNNNNNNNKINKQKKNPKEETSVFLEVFFFPIFFLLNFNISQIFTFSNFDLNKFENKLDDFSLFTHVNVNNNNNNNKCNTTYIFISIAILQSIIITIQTLHIATSLSIKTTHTQIVTFFQIKYKKNKDE